MLPEATSVGVERFSDEARSVLESKGFVVYTLTAESINSFRKQGRKFWSSWHNDYPEFEALISRVAEVAINPDPDRIFLKGSFAKDLSGQINMIAKLSQELQIGSNRIPGVEAIMGEAADYTELFFKHLDSTGDYLLGEKYVQGDIWLFARTNTPTVNSGVASVGDFDKEAGLRILHTKMRRDGRDDLVAVPLLVPILVPTGQDK